MDWIEGYEIVDDALYSPSGEKDGRATVDVEGFDEVS